MALMLSAIHDKVQEELKKRMDNKAKRDEKSIYTRSTWLRMWSTSDKKTIISGGLLSGKKTRGGFDKIYSPKSEDGNSYRPLPGIRGLSVDYKGEFGSTRTATIQWTIWSFEDLQKLQGLFLREGKTVVVEWGWSTGDKSQTLGLDPGKICDVYKSVGLIRKAVTNSGGNFDAMIGLVSGWTWTLREDGGIDCTTELISHGSNALDLTTIKKDAENDGDKERLEHFVENLYKHLESDKYCGSSGEWKGKDGAAAQYISDETAYVSWGFIEDEIVTKHIAMETKGGVKLPMMKSMTYDNDDKNPKPTLIYCPPSLETIHGEIIDIKRKGPFSPFKNEENNGGKLRNLAIHANKVVLAFAESDNIEGALTNLFRDMNAGACNIWDFKIVDNEERTGEFGVIDTNWTSKNVKDTEAEAFIFPTWSSNSIVRDQNMEAKVPDSMAITTMYGAMQPKDDKADGEPAELAIQKGAEKLSSDDPADCCLDSPEGNKDAQETKKGEDGSTNVATTDTEKQLEAATKKERTTPEETEITKESDKAKDVCSKVNKEKGKQVSFIYPITLELTVDGISGIQWGNTVHTEFIPKIYKEECVFQVTSVNHSIDKSDWSTVIQTVCRIDPN
tara:strand:+ start:3685 stop:5535 length:1851 start_codon:yes stop_codon:yes gene_type:complete